MQFFSRQKVFNVKRNNNLKKNITKGTGVKNGTGTYAHRGLAAGQPARPF
jgi:hypothetical protein